MTKRMVIIGAGMAGLAAGCYARMNGLEAEIYEAHSVAGGLCTAWKRGDYTFDGCLHWLTGAGPASPFHRFWNELGALKGRPMVMPECFYRFTASSGREVWFYSDADRLEAHLLEISPEDRKMIRDFCRLIRKFSRFSMPMDKPFELFGKPDIFRMILSMIPYGRDFRRLNSLTIRQYARGFRSPDIREALQGLLMNTDSSLTAVVFTLAGLHDGSSGYPVGGSKPFALSIADRFVSLGGHLHLSSPVRRILVREGRAAGIELEDGRQVEADYVVAAGDLRRTLEGLLEGKYPSPVHRALFDTVPSYSSCVQVSLGLDRTFDQARSCVGEHLPLAEPLTIGSETLDRFTFREYGMDPTLAPEGKTSAIVMFNSDDFAYWETLYRDREAYKKEKARLLAAALKELERYYPGISGQVEVSDVATPMTYVRYARTWHGKFMTWITTPENSRTVQALPKTVPGVENLYLSGMWLMAPGGVPVGVKTSRDILQIICRKEGRPFTVSEDR